MTAPHRDRPTAWQLLHVWPRSATTPAPTPTETVGEALERAGPQPQESPIAWPKMVVIPRGTRGEIVVRRNDHHQRTRVTIQLRLRGCKGGVAFGMSRYAAVALARAIVQLLDLDPSEL